MRALSIIAAAVVAASIASPSLAATVITPSLGGPWEANTAAAACGKLNSAPEFSLHYAVLLPTDKWLSVFSNSPSAFSASVSLSLATYSPASYYVSGTGIDRSFKISDFTAVISCQ